MIRQPFISILSLGLLTVVLWPIAQCQETKSLTQEESISLKNLTLPTRLDSLSVLGCWRKDVIRCFGSGLYSEEGGHGGTTYFTDPAKRVILRVVWGVDWHVDELSFSRGEPEDLPPSIRSIKEMPDSSISSSVYSKLALDGKIRLGSTPKHVMGQWGRPSIDTLEDGIRYLLYQADYRTTKDVLSYECWFRFKNNHLVRFRVYNGE